MSALARVDGWLDVVCELHAQRLALFAAAAALPSVRVCLHEVGWQEEEEEGGGGGLDRGLTGATEAQKGRSRQREDSYRRRKEWILIFKVFRMECWRVTDMEVRRKRIDIHTYTNTYMHTHIHTWRKRW